ncbi:hypothetical protein E1200_16195 [Actinomadura sp. GC306]|uniref:hypothetical protein n=1 Tax=Actinomadura sp. GC306 TaxID=2530367 RepID=UPI00104EB86C|nr:hypothetical protein [Actinomadura sp. GC306]TDC66818.1 hypothetical protein E1200_16195 [Actinomadura sp. GC306]
MTLPRLTEAEQRLWTAFPRGEWVDLRTGDPEKDDVAAAADWGGDRVIRAEVIAALLLGAVPPDTGRRPGVRLRGARIEGRLDLIGADVGYALVCEHCHFDAPVRLVEATARTARLVHSSLHSLNAARLGMHGILNLYRSTVRAGIRLDRARVNGEISLRGARIGPGERGVAVAADGLVVDGQLEADEGFRADGPVLLRGGRVEGRLDLGNATVVGGDAASRALSLSRTTIGGGLHAAGLAVHGETALRSTRVQAEVLLDSAVLRNPGGVALGAGGLTVEGPFFARDGFTADGELRMPGAQIRTFLTIAGASLSAPDGAALWADQVVVNDVDAADLTVAGGRVSLVGARIAGDLTLTGADLDPGRGARRGGERVALDADNITVGGTFDCRRLRARGEVRAVVGRISGRLTLNDARLEKPGGRTCLRLSRAELAADLFAAGLHATGRVRLSGTRVGGQADLTGARLAYPGGVALDAPNLQAGELTLRPSGPVEGAVVLAHARIGVLHDDPRTWAPELSLNGLAYESLEPRLPARERLRWLALDPDGHHPQPYERLAAHYTALGQPVEARRVLLARERIAHRAGTPAARVWGLLQEAAVAYGYQPWRAVLWLALLVTAGGLVYGTHPPAPLKADEAPHFNPVVYTLDLLLPLVDLGQQRAFNPAGGYQWFSYALVAAGWILVTVIAAAVARVLSRR